MRRWAEKGYAAFFDVVSVPRQYADLDQMPEEVTGDRHGSSDDARSGGVRIRGRGIATARSVVVDLVCGYDVGNVPVGETTDHPFVGEVVAYDGDGHELGRTETLVYTRSRVRIPLERMPEEETVFLRFEPRGSGRAPLPASVEWNAPPDYIGET